MVTRQMFNQTSLCGVNDIVFASDPEYGNMVLLWKAGETSDVEGAHVAGLITVLDWYFQSLFTSFSGGLKCVSSSMHI